MTVQQIPDRYSRTATLLKELVEVNADYRAYKKVKGLWAHFGGARSKATSLHQIVLDKGDELISFVMEEFPLTDAEEAKTTYHEYWATLTEELLAEELSLEEGLRRVPEQITPIVLMKICISYYCIAFDSHKMKMFGVFFEKYKRILML